MRGILSEGLGSIKYKNDHARSPDQLGIALDFPLTE
jgi:hypothetical protein